RVETISGVGGGRHVQRAIKLASPWEVVCSRSAGTSVPDLCRDDSRPRESHNKRTTAHDDVIHGAARADLHGRRIGPHASWAERPRSGPAEGLAGGAGAK